MARLQLGFPFSDHLVLQRGQSNPVWGWDRPGQCVKLTVEGGPRRMAAEVRASATGEFSLGCPPLPPGGPYRMVVEGSQRIILDDLASGEVWLAAGQSNMEWPVSASAQADAEIGAAEAPLIRLLKVSPQASWEPTRRATGSWVPAHPTTAGDFTAVGYYFARELHQHLSLPIGVIDCSWGGTPIAAWTSLEGLRPVMRNVDAELATLRAQLPNEPVLRVEYEAVLAAWEREVFPADPPNTGEQLGFAQPDFDDSGWKKLRLPAFWQHHGMPFNGVVWFRRALDLPGSWAGRDLVLSLGPIDDFDHTYFNGSLVGSLPVGTPNAFQRPRQYSIPGRLARSGRNVIAVRVFDHFGEGGFAGPARSMTIAPADAPDEQLPLGGAWSIFAECPIPLVPASIFATYPQPPALLAPQCIPSQLHNGMIAPVAPFGIRGLLWYQGESDVDRYHDYAHHLIALIRDLRSTFARGVAALPLRRAGRVSRRSQLAVVARSPTAGHERTKQHPRHGA